MNVFMRITGHLACATGWALVCLTCPAKLLAQCEVQKLTAFDVGDFDVFGSSLSMSNDAVLIGAPQQDCATGFDCGASYVYRLSGSTWVQEQKLTAFDPASNRGFGISVSIDGNVAIVGAGLLNCAAGIYCGAAYVYRFDGSSWIGEQQLVAHDASSFDYFGSAVSISGNVAVVGAYLKQCASGLNCGAAYVFRFDGSTWTEEQKLADSEQHDVFGRSVSVSDDAAVVGAYGANCAAGFDCGAAFVYRFNGATWVHEQKLVASDASPGAMFGHVASLDHDVAMIGAPGGAAYAYRFNGLTWVEEQKLDLFEVEQAGAVAEFVQDISLRDGFAVVSTLEWDFLNQMEYSGSAFLYWFDGSTWVFQQTLRPSGLEVRDRFGYSVAVSANNAVVSAPADQWATGFGLGSACIFALGPDCNANGEADLCDIRDGDSDDADSDGIPDECEIISVSLDIKPGACPNPFNPKSRGVLSLAVVGSSVFDVTEIDTASLLLLRPTSHGGRVRPISDPPGHGPRIADVVTFFDAPPCHCLPQGPDGHDDLILKFSTSEMVEALNLDASAAGDSVMLTLTGFLKDGTPFAGMDCLHIVGPSVTPLSVEFAKQPSAAPNRPASEQRDDAVPTPVGRVPSKD